MDELTNCRREIADLEAQLDTARTVIAQLGVRLEKQIAVTDRVDEARRNLESQMATWRTAKDPHSEIHIDVSGISGHGPDDHFRVSVRDGHQSFVGGFDVSRELLRPDQWGLASEAITRTVTQVMQEIVSRMYPPRHDSRRSSSGRG